MQQCRRAPADTVGALRDAGHETKRGLSSQRRRRRAGATRERLRIEERDNRDVRRRRTVTRGTSWRKREYQLRDGFGIPARLGRVKASEHQPRRGRAARREYRRAASTVGINGDERFAAQRVGEIAAAAARDLVVQIPRKSVAGNEDVRFAAEAPAERGGPPVTGASH